MFIIIIIEQAAACLIQGNLQTPKHFPATNVQVLYQNFQTMSHLDGSFKINVNSEFIDGDLIFNIANDFSMKLTLKHLSCPAQLGEIILDNHQTIETEISGCIYQSDDQQPANFSLVEIFYDQPTLLDRKLIEANSQGCFHIFNKLMKFLVYGVMININQKGYLNHSTRTTLYGSYSQNLGQLQLIPDYYEASIKILITNNCQDNSQNSEQKQFQNLVSLSCGLSYKTKLSIQKDKVFELDLKNIFKKGFIYTCGILIQDLQCGIAYNVFKVQQDKPININLSIGKKVENNTQKNETQSKFQTKLTGKVVEMQNYVCSNQNQIPIADVEVKFYLQFAQKEFVNQTNTQSNGNFELIAGNPIIDGQFSGILEFTKENYLTNQVDFTFSISQKNQEYQIGIIQLLNLKGVVDC